MENIWSLEGLVNRGVNLLHNEKLSYLYTSQNIFGVFEVKEKMLGSSSITYGGEERRIQGYSGRL